MSKYYVTIDRDVRTSRIITANSEQEAAEATRAVPGSHIAVQAFAFGSTFMINKAGKACALKDYRDEY